MNKSSSNKMAGTCKENGSGRDAKKGDGRKTFIGRRNGMARLGRRGTMW